MEENRAELIFPFGGLNDSEALTDQPEATTTEAVNVRPYDPVTGRRRGAQRPGLKNYNASALVADTRVQSLLPVPYAQNRLNYSELSTPTQDWAVVTPSQGTASAMTVDKNGYIYVFDGTTGVVKYNADGTKLATMPLPASVGAAATKRVAVDEFGHVFAGVSGVNGSLVQRWKLTEDDVYQLSWLLEVPGILRDMKIINDLLYVAQDNGPYLDVTALSEITVYAGLQSDYTPPEIWQKDVPHPLHAFDVTSSGALYWTAAPNAERLGTSGGGGTYAESQVDWTPLRMTNIASRLHHWMDAAYIPEQSTGIEHLDYVNSGKSIPSITARTDAPYSDVGVSAHDTSARAMEGPDDTWAKIQTGVNASKNEPFRRSGPQYLAQAWGQLPALVFTQRALLVNGGVGQDQGSMQVAEGGCSLVSNYNRKDDAALDDLKLSLTDSLEQNRAPIPGHENARWVFALCGRVDFDESPGRSVVFTICDRGFEDDVEPGGSAIITMMANADQSGDGTTHAAASGNVTIFIKGATFTTADESSDTVETDWAPFDLDAIDAAGRFILTIVMDHGTRKGAIRINGRAVDSFTVTDASTFSFMSRGRDQMHNANNENLPAGRMILGGPTPGHNWNPDDKFLDQTGDYPHIAFNAWQNFAEEWQPPWISGIAHDAFGGNVAGTTSASGAYVVGHKCGHFSGEICEMITVLADSSGTTPGTINDVSTKLAPVKTSGATGQTAETGEANCNTLDADGTKSDAENLEGYLAWKWGIASVLPASLGTPHEGLQDRHPFYAAPPASASTTVVGYDNSAYTQALISNEGITGKVTPNGDGLWAVHGGGMGYGLVANEDNEVFTVGPVQADSVNPSTGTPEPSVQARKIVDQGSAVSTDPADGAWTYDRLVGEPDLTSEEIGRYPKLVVDSSDNLYWPIANTSKANHVRRLDGSTGAENWKYSISNQCQAFGVALPPTTPTYDDDTVTGPEFVYICSDNGEQDGTQDLALPQLHKIRQILAEQNIDSGTSARAVKLAAVVNGGIYEVTSTTSALATNGASALDGGSAFISGVTAFSKGYFTDGLAYKQYDPKAGEVSDWAAEKGEIPPRAKLIGFWRGRMVLARDPEDPQDWHMSALGDADDWDKNPAILTATMAISGNNARCGKMPDAVNAIIPYSDDLLLFGCDSNIYRLTGDPMAGGQLDSVSTVTGVAFGEAWCKDPEGIIYFFGSRGGVYAMSPQGEIQSLTQARIERRLQDIDLERYRIKLVWNDREQGLHVYQCPFYFDGVVLKAWYWDKRNNAWFEDELASSAKQVASTCVMDGDSYDDRRLLIGCEDGVVRMYDNEIATDDGDRVDSRVLFGPMVVEQSSMKTRFCKLGIELASDQNGAEYDWYVGRAADERGDPVRSGVLNSGSNGYPGGMFKGTSAWVRLRNGADAQRWALEAMSLSAYPAGRKRL